MAANKIVMLEPVALTNTLTTNIWEPPTTTGGVGVPPNCTNCYYIIRHIRVVNKTAGPVTVSLWRGATTGNVAGTEFLWQGTSVAANSFIEAYGAWRLAAGDTNQFIVGGASAATSLTIEGEAEIGIV